MPEALILSVEVDPEAAELVDELPWRDDRGFMERICPHGVGHPDPDDLFADPIHGCDGCCDADRAVRAE